MCCLAYENEFYSEINGKMPKINARVKTPDGVGSVIYNNLLKQVCTVRIENESDSKISEYTLDQLTVIPKENVQPKPAQKEKQQNVQNQQNKTQNNAISKDKQEKLENSDDSKTQNKKKFKKFKKHGNSKN